MTIHYHGTPITPRARLLEMTGAHFCVSHAAPRDADVCLSIGQSVMFDNGAFSKHTMGKATDWRAYYDWLEPRLGHPHRAVIPDVIGGSEEDQFNLRRKWPFKHFGAPVWHMNLSIVFLLGLADIFPRICFGSAAQYWQVGSDAWRARADEAFNELAKRHGRRLPAVHMLRGMALAGSEYPFASVDSTNVARNWKRNGLAPEAMARRIDATQCGTYWPHDPPPPVDRGDWRKRVPDPFFTDYLKEAA